MKVVSDIIRKKVDKLIKEAKQYKTSGYLDKTIEKIKNNDSFKVVTNETQEDIASLKATRQYDFVGNERQLRRLIGSVMQGKNCNLKVAIAIHAVAMEQKALIESLE